VRRAVHERDAGVEEGRVAQAVARVGLGEAHEPGHRVGLARRGRLERGGELGEVVRDREHEQLLLGGEAAVDQPAGDARGARDLLDRRVLHAALVEQRPRDLHEVALALAGALRRGRAGRHENASVTVVLIRG
jgi:hypothetical protein